MLAADFALEAGFSTVEAGDADEAIRILQGRSDVALVFTDIDMPGLMNGLELAEVVCHRWPPIQVVVTSGKMRPSPDELPDLSHFVPKPYSYAQLTGLLRALCS